MTENPQVAGQARHSNSVEGFCQESSSWHAAYDSEVQVKRRRSAMPLKLRRLGVLTADSSARILDLCCGNGETLAVLHELGFRNLHGLDVVISPALAADARFSVNTGDATEAGFPENSLDWVLIIHALHHLGPVTRIEKLLQECYRILKPGGRLAIVDFPASLQIRIAFWCFRRNFWLCTPYLKYFGRLIQEEWHFLKGYLAGWPETCRLLHRGGFEKESFRQEFFYYYLTLRKPRGESVGADGFTR
jgi:ubiquinone/menaquinone biosynthesis C-methylase UbiE